MHVGTIRSIYIATDGTFGLVRVLPMVGSRHSATTAAPLAVRIQVAYLYRLTFAFLPFNLNVGVVHIDLRSQHRVGGKYVDLDNWKISIIIIIIY